MIFRIVGPYQVNGPHYYIFDKESVVPSDNCHHLRSDGTLDTSMHIPGQAVQKGFCKTVRQAVQVIKSNYKVRKVGSNEYKVVK